MGKKTSGKRCEECGAVGVPADETLCKPCRLAEEEGPEARRLYFKELARKGAEATNARRGQRLRAEELPPLDGHEAAKAWMELLARKVATGALEREVAGEVRRAVKGWMEAHKAEVLDEWKQEIEAKLAEIERRRDRPWE